MTRNTLVFIATFAIGAAAGLAFRSAAHDPHEKAESHVATRETTPMVDNAPPRELTSPASSTGEGHGAHTARSTTQEAHSAHSPPASHNTADTKTVNTVCAICGMDVDPSLPTMEYKGKVVGFGCKMCLPKFKTDPDLYGPAALSNRVVE